MRLFNLEQERVFLAGILAFPDFFVSEILDFVNENDFYSKDSVVNKTIFSQCKSLLDSKNSLDLASLSFHLKSINLSFKDNITIDEYLESLSSFGVSPAIFVTARNESAVC